MNYEEAVNYINNTGAKGIVPGTDVIKHLLDLLGSPQKDLKVIHVAGTNGKGSVCAYLEAALLECGLKTGRYSSPSVFEYLERIRLNGKNITEDEYAEAVSAVREAAGGMSHKPTSFEAETAAAFLYFKLKKADVIIVECGMGGLEDATNVFDNPLACVFTPVSMDHMQFLGNDPEAIARNKAGIMRRGCPAIISDMPEIVLSGKRYDPAGALFDCAQKSGAIPVDASDYKVPEKVVNPLSGRFQEVNLQTALCSLETIKEKLGKLFPGKKITNDIFIKGVSRTRHPGRYEKVSVSPLIIRDGAHNPAAAEALRESLERDETLPRAGKIHLIMGVFKDKDYQDILRIMLPGASTFTAIDLPDKVRGLPSDELADAARMICKEESIRAKKGPDKAVPFPSVIKTAGSLKEALIPAQKAGPEDIFVVFGSLSLMQLFGSADL